MGSILFHERNKHHKYYDSIIPHTSYSIHHYLPYYNTQIITHTT